jgi:hypothetical protein
VAARAFDNCKGSILRSLARSKNVSASAEANQRFAMILAEGMWATV